MRRGGPLRLAISLAVLGARGGAAAAVVDYLYLEPNVGTASGGHVALRVEDAVYHYQNVGDGTLRLAREPVDFFRYVYGVLENRPIHVGRFDVDADTTDRIREHFEERYWTEARDFEELHWLRRDVELGSRLLARGGGDIAPGERPQSDDSWLSGAGYFLPSQPGRAGALVELRERIARARGPEFLAGRMAEVDRELFRLQPSDASQGRSTFALRAVELAEARLALETLLAAHPLRPALYWAPTTPAFELAPHERRALASFTKRLERQLAALVASHRPDWGRALLTGLARLQALDASLRGGRLVVLDVFPRDARVLEAAAAASRAAFLEDLRAFSQQQFVAARTAAFTAPTLTEDAYNALESAANRTLEVSRGLAEARDIRVAPGRLVPAGEAPLPDRLLPAARKVDLLESLRTARARERERTRELTSRYRYDLIRRNCASEIIATLEAAFPPDEVERHLGGRVGEPRRSGERLAFVPSFAFDAVRRRYRMAESGTIPSYRQTRLAEMAERENALTVFLRESNTLTSTVYRRTPGDSFFLFFTTDSWWTRPVFGALNVVAGLGETVLGALTLPFDRGTRLASGASSAFFSVPELFFVNIRKGRFEYSLREPGRLEFAPVRSGDAPR